MNAIQNNWLKMLYAVEKFLKDNLSKLVDKTPVLADYVTQLTIILDKFRESEFEAELPTGGTTAQNKENLKLMAEAALIVSFGLQAYFKAIDKDLLAKEAKVTRTTFLKGAGTKKLYKAECLLELADNNALASAPFGVTETRRNTLRETVAAYKKSLGQPARERAKSKKGGEDVDQLFEEAFAVLSFTDALVGTHIKDYPDECLQYEGDRKIINNRSGKSKKPDKIVTLKAHEKKVVLTGEFEIFKRIRVKNNGKGWLNWGKTSKADNFTGKFFISNAGKVSFYKVKTLGEDGNMILFENPNNFPVKIEVTVLDK